MRPSRPQCENAPRSGWRRSRTWRPRPGVGVGTVSRGVERPSRGHHRRPASACGRPWRTLDFHPNRAARALSRQRSGAIAVIVPFVTQPSSVERLRGVLSVIDESPFEIVLYGVDFSERRHQRLSRIFRPERRRRAARRVVATARRRGARGSRRR